MPLGGAWPSAAGWCKAPSRIPCKVLTKGCPSAWCPGLSEDVAKGLIARKWIWFGTWGYCHLGDQPAFHQSLCHLLGWKTGCNSLWWATNDPRSWGWLTSTRVAPAPHLTASWHEPVNYKQRQLVRQAAIYSASPFSCMHISLPSTAGLMQANEKEDETKFLWWILLPFSKCYLSHFSAIGRDHDDNISFKSPVLMISSLNTKLLIVSKDRQIARNKLRWELSQYRSLKRLAFGGVQ